MTWSRQQYEDRMRSRLGDLGVLQHIPETSIPLALERALATFTKDRPRTAADTFSGDGTTQAFDLTTLQDWEPTWSRIESLEYPTGEVPKEYLDAGHDFTTEDDELLIFAAPETGADNIKVRFTAKWAFPDDDPTDDPNPIPEIYAQAIADLAAANLVRGKAVEFARQQSTSVAGDLFQRDAQPLFDAAREWKQEYEDTVLGRADTEDRSGSQVAMAVADVAVFPNSLFHQRAHLDEADREYE